MINLIFNNGYRWHSFYDILFKGYFYDQAGRYHAGDDAAVFFADALKTFSPAALKKICSSIDGCWSVVIRQWGQTLIASDTMNMFPVFYTLLDGKWLVSDSTAWLARQRPGIRLNEHARAEFLAAGFVMGRETLFEEIYQVRAGEVVLLTEGHRKVAVQSDTWHYFLPGSFTEEPIELLKDRLVSVLSNVSFRLLSSLKGERLVVPLSGGYDSRLIVCMLKKAGYENVTCFTYGRPNPESVISQKVAEKLGYEWIFADYTRIDTNGYLESPVFQAYHNYAGNHTSMPYLQEYFGVKYLKDNKLIPANSIFLPGHTGDYLAGSYLEKTIRLNDRPRSNFFSYLMRSLLSREAAEGTPDRSDSDHDVIHGISDATHSANDLPANLQGRIIRNIAASYFPFIPLNKEKKEEIQARLESWFSDYSPPACATDPEYSVYVEDWDLKEKIAKFIFNSASVFPFFGYGFRLPLWDREFREFFRQLPFRHRLNKSLYDEVLVTQFFEPLGVGFGADELPAPAGSGLPLCLMAARKKTGSMVKRLLPPAMAERKIRKNDWICYHRFTREMVNDMHQNNFRAPKRVYAYNALICSWYVKETGKLCNKLNAI